MANGYPSDYEAKETICEIGRRMYHRGLVGGVDGNLSVRVSADTAWVTPTMACKGFLTPDMLLRMSLAGEVLTKSGHRPSSETLMHLRVYQTFPHIKAVLHAHPIHATILSAVGEDIPCDLLTEGVYFFGDVLHVAPFAMPGTEELGDSVVPYVDTSSAALLANHGALSWGEDLQEAFIAMESMETYCQVYLYTEYLIGKHRKIPPEKWVKLGRKHRAL